jgi:hypothetical protein
MHENIDGALRVLAQEINEGLARRKEDSRSSMIALGRKMIEARELLRQRNGVISQRPVVDGFHPVGWKDWVAENLTVTPETCSGYIRWTLNPEQFDRWRKSQNARHYSGKYQFVAFKKAWSQMAPELKAEVCGWIRDRIIEERTNAKG